MMYTAEVSWYNEYSDKADKMDIALYNLGEILEKIAKDFDDVRQGLVFYKEQILSKVSSNVALRENK